MVCWKDACGVYATLLHCYNVLILLHVIRACQSVPDLILLSLAFLPDEKKRTTVYIYNCAPFKCNHTLFVAVCEASTRAFEIYYSHFCNYIVCIFYIVHCKFDMIGSDTSSLRWKSRTSWERSRIFLFFCWCFMAFYLVLPHFFKFLSVFSLIFLCFCWFFCFTHTIYSFCCT